MSEMALCGSERDVNASPDSAVAFAPQRKTEVKTAGVTGVTNSIGRADASKITQSVSQFTSGSRFQQRTELTEIFFVPLKAEPILPWHQAESGTAKDFAGSLKLSGDAKPISSGRLEEILESMRDRME